jgi:hypothetical protein
MPEDTEMEVDPAPTTETQNIADEIFLLESELEYGTGANRNATLEEVRMSCAGLFCACAV